MKKQTLEDVLEQIRKEKEAICASLGKEYGTVIPSLGLETIDNNVGPPSDDIDGDPEEKAEYLDIWKEAAVFYCKAFTQGKARGNGSHTMGGEKRGTYRKPFERRLRLVEFVTAQWARSTSSQFDWKGTAESWNKAFPIEQIKPEVLRVEYSRAIRENDLMSHLLATLCLKDRQTDEKRFSNSVLDTDLDEFNQFFLETAPDSTRKGEPILSLMYKHYVLGGMSKQIPMNKKRMETALKLSKRFREMCNIKFINP